MRIEITKKDLEKAVWNRGEVDPPTKKFPLTLGSGQRTAQPHGAGRWMPRVSVAPDGNYLWKIRCDGSIPLFCRE
jgi:hypothetical protein